MLERKLAGIECFASVARQKGFVKKFIDSRLFPRNSSALEDNRSIHAFEPRPQKREDKGMEENGGGTS